MALLAHEPCLLRVQSFFFLPARTLEEKPGSTTIAGDVQAMSGRVNGGTLSKYILSMRAKCAGSGVLLSIGDQEDRKVEKWRRRDNSEYYCQYRIWT